MVITFITNQPNLSVVGYLLSYLQRDFHRLVQAPSLPLLSQQIAAPLSQTR